MLVKCSHLMLVLHPNALLRAFIRFCMFPEENPAFNELLLNISLKFVLFFYKIEIILSFWIFLHEKQDTFAIQTGNLLRSIFYYLRVDY